MSSPKSSTDFQGLPPTEVPRYVEIWAAEVSRILTKGLGFQDNFDAIEAEVTFSAANTDTIVSHGLKRTPTRYLVTSLSAPLIVYSGTGQSTDSLIYLRASATGTATILIY